MIIVMKEGADEARIAAVEGKIGASGLKAHVMRGEGRTVVGVAGDASKVDPAAFRLMPGVESVVPVGKPYKRAGMEYRGERTVIGIPPVRGGDRGLEIGGNGVVVMAGPCAVESREMLLSLAAFLKESGARMLRGGAFKPRTLPDAFEGLGVEGLRYLAEQRSIVGLPIVTEVRAACDVEMFSEFVDLIQVGARNMQDYALLKALGQCRKPVMLKRGPSNTVEELLASAEYVLNAGNEQVILCERGIRTFEPSTRFTLDLGAVPVLKRESHLPVVVDPSHGTGRWDLVTPMALAAVAAGADGLLVEVHPEPAKAVADGEQSLTPRQFKEMMDGVEKVARAVGRGVA
jgi:3-deoxy-7-phosphoheptulonate synthase